MEVPAGIEILPKTALAVSYCVSKLMATTFLSLLLAILFQSTTVPIKGTVVDSEGNRPMSEVQVLFGAPGKSSGTVTDSEGKFSIALPDGSYDVTPIKDGYVPAVASAGISVTIQPGVPVNELRLHLRRGSVVTGRVFEEDGQPSAQKRVWLLRRTYDENGSAGLITDQNVIINDRGEYRFFGVDSGEYFVAVDSVDPRRSPNRFVTTFRDPPNVPTYYPGTLEPLGAERFFLKPGAEIQLRDMTVKNEQPVAVTLHVDNLSGIAPILLFVEFSMGHVTLLSRSFDRPDLSQTFELNPLPPGDYECRVSLQGAEVSISSQTTIHVEHSPVDLNVSLNNGHTIEGHMELQDGTSSKPVSGVAVSTWSPQQGNSKPIGSGPDGVFRIRGLASGKRRFRFLSTPAGMYVSAIQNRDVDIPADGIDVVDDISVHIHFRTDGGSLTGNLVDSDAEKVKFGIAVLVPDEPERSFNYYVAYGSEDGNLSIRDLAPGNYHIYAWKKLEGAAYLNSEFMDAYRGKGKALKIESGKTLELNSLGIQ